jgi:hypothetical protein
MLLEDACVIPVFDFRNTPCERFVVGNLVGFDTVNMGWQGLNIDQHRDVTGVFEDIVPHDAVGFSIDLDTGNSAV